MRVHLEGELEQEAFGSRLAACLPPTGVVFLEGNLGAGKTTLVRGVLRGAGYRGPVKSPTYTLIEPYDVGARSYAHLDLYRLGDPEELEYLGLRDLLAEGRLLLVEWPERGRGMLPVPDLLLHIEYAAGGRDITLQAGTPAGLEALARLEE